MAVAGSLTYETKLDTSGFQKGMNDIESKTKSGGASVKNIVAGLGITKLVTKAIDTIKNSMDGAISRLDTMNNFPRVMSNLGISAKDSQQAINKLSEGLQGIPTTLDAGALAVQRFTSKNGDVKKSADLFLAVNDAILAGGASSQIQESALEQLSQAYSKGKMDMMEWRTIQMAMPAQLKQVATAMGLTTDELGEMLRTGDNTEQVFDDFLNTIMRMDKEGVKGFKSLKEQARNATGGIQTSITNMKTAIVRGVATMIQEFDKILKKKGFGGISQIITEVGKKIEGLFKEISRYMPKVIDFVSGLFNVMKKLQPVILAVVTAFIAYKATLLAIEAISIVTSIVKTVSAFISLIPAIKSADDAMKLLNMTMNANPVGIIVAGIAALTAAGLAFYHSQTEGIRKLDDEVKKSTESINEYVNSYKEAQKVREESVNQSLSELDYYQNLWNELKNITDENGKVNAGYEQRAQFIVTTLNEALGTEITMTDGIIQNIGELNTAIDEHIKKMKAEAVMSAQKDLYEEAIKKRTKAIDELYKAEAEKTKQETVLSQAEENYSKSVLKFLGPVRQEYQKQIKAQKERVETATENYNNLQNTVKGYYSSIAEYEAMQVDYEAGNYDKITAIHYDYQNTLEGDVQAQKEASEKQIEQTRTDLSILEELKKKYNTNIFDDDIKATKDHLDELEKRYNETYKITETKENEVGILTKEELKKRVKNIKDKNKDFKNASGENIDSSIQGMKEKGPIAEYEAGKIGEKAATSMGNQKGKATEAGGWLLDGLLGGLTDLIKQNTILRAVTGFAGSVLGALRKGLKENSPSKASKQYGEWLLQGLNVGIDNEKNDVLNNIDEFSNDIVNRMASAVNVQTGKMAFSGTSGTVNQILTATGTTTVVNENKLLLDGDVVYENQKKVTARKNLQTQFGGAYSVSN